jgi:hypothetical protein
LKFSFAYRGKVFEQAAPPPPPKPRPQKASKKAEAPVKSKDQVQSALNQTSAVGDTLAAVGTLMGSAGSGLWQAGSQLRGQAEQAERVTKMPETTANRVNTAFGGKINVAPGAILMQSPASQSGSLDPFNPTGPSVDLEPEAWILTTPVAPGDALNVDLVVEKSQPFRAARCQFKLLSRPHEDLSQVQSTPYTLDFQGMSWIVRFIPYAVYLGMVAITILVAALVLLRVPGLLS